MYFDSTIYFVFLALIVAVYWRFEFRAQNWLLLAASYFFYGWWDYRFLLLMGASTCINYTLSHHLERTGDGDAGRRRLFLFAIALNLAFLGFFKYFNFFIDSAVDMFHFFGAQPPARRWLEILLPPGISFYTFQEVAYLVDVYSRRIKPARRLADYALFVSVFPHLIAGPIQRPDHLLPQLQSPRKFQWGMFFDGLLLILEGLFRKIVIADNCALVANAAFGGKFGAQPTLPVVLLGFVAFAWQIYGDFSGYSSMARGSAQLLGLHFMVNFKQPYLATSLQDFWRRWHISLSTWLRDYLYIPLGGNRLGERKTNRNLLYTMLLGGLWHGANWTFVVWGFMHGAGLGIERFLGWGTGGVLSESEVARIASAWMKRCALFILVGAAWIFFRAASVSEAVSFLAASMRIEQNQAMASALRPALLGAAVFLAFYSLPLLLLDLRLEGKAEEYAFQGESLPIRVGFGLALLTAVFIFGANQSNAFIYFQF